MFGRHVSKWKNCGTFMQESKRMVQILSNNIVISNHDRIYCMALAAG